jgi:hypothetical protein
MIYKKLKYLLIVLVGILFLLPLNLNAKENGKNKRPIMKSKDGSQVATTRMDINNLNALQANNGYSDYNLNSNLEGTEYPKGSGKTAVFEAGFLWGGFVPGDAQVRVGGSAYRTGLQPGPIINGVAADPGDPKYSIYRVRPDVYPGGPKVDLSSDAALEGVTEASLRAQYESDWTNWPAAGTANDLGAPFKDVNNDGKYEPGTDIPGVPGADQTIYYVANDLNSIQTNSLYGAQPFGLELHATFWAYAQSGALGNMYFKKWNLINKGGNTIDSMFVSFWADVDLGASGDDLVGCDTTLSLQYTYNGQPTDAVYAPLPPPADGFDFFQGPIVAGAPTDQAIFKGQVIPGKKNLPMTAAYFFINGDPNFGDPPQGDISGSTQFYHFFNGEYGLAGTPFVDNKGNLTKFAFPGDPASKTGWIDGVEHAPADRRQGMASGPFTMAPGDTQEVVVAEMFAGAIPGVDYLSAISLCKFYDVTAQSAYNNFFAIPTAPPAPQVSVVNLNNKVVLDWGENLAAVKATENYNSLGYTFEGYNVYQIPPAGSTSNIKLLATFDLVDNILKISDDTFDPTSGEVIPKVYEFGTDSGIKRMFIDSLDAVMNVGQPLANGTRYYFAVTAYSYNATSVPHHLENPIAILTAIPQGTGPGVRISHNVGDTIIATHSAGKSDGNVIVLVVDPTRLTGDQYKVTFDTTGGNTWKLTDVTKNTVVLTGQTNQTGDDNYSYVDGMQVKVFGAALDFKQFLVTANGAGPINPPVEGTFAFNSSGFPTSNLLPADGVNDRPPANQQVGGGKWGIATGMTASNDGSYAYFLTRVPRNDDFTRIIPYDFEIRFTAAGSTGNFAFTSGNNATLPFEIWNTGIGTPTDPSDDYELVAFINDVNGDEKYDLDGVDHVISGGDNDPETDWIYIEDVTDHTPGHKGYDAAVADNFNSGVGKEIMARLTLVNWNGGSVSDPTFPANVNQQMPETGTIFRIVTTKPNSLTDQFTFTATAPTSSTALAKTDVNSINVFPNPYYGVNSQETLKYAKFVTFNHLPATATIRIFNLAGAQVRIINHTDGTQFQQWDLTNDSGLPVASGLYIVYIDMPAIGATKIIKAAIIQEQQFPDHF